MNGYAELTAMSNFSFLRGASHPDELVSTAKALGLEAIAIADRNTLAGVVRAHRQARETGMRLIPGCRLVMRCGFEVVSLPTDLDAYKRLSRLLTIGKRRTPKGACDLTLNDVIEWGDGQIFIALPPYDWPQDFTATLTRLAQAFPQSVFLGLARYFRAEEHLRLARLHLLSLEAGAPMVTVGDVYYHAPERRILQDVLTCTREKVKIKEAGFSLQANAERHLKPAAEIYRLFNGYEEAVARSVAIAERCTFNLDQLTYDYPKELIAPYKTAQEAIEKLTWRGADNRYPDGVPENVAKQLRHELTLIGSLDYAPYFLTVFDIVRFARERGILCQGRGSAANSAVCYCLGITSVDPHTINLLFERFISAERKEPPDIDVDFEHERREEVIAYIYEKYGRERAAITATIQTYRARGAIRDVGKALGLSEDVLSALSSTVWGWGSGGVEAKHIAEAGISADDPLIAMALKLTEELIGFPRHLGQHSGGFVITHGRLDEIVPIDNAAMEGRTFIEWDKDDLDALGLLKIDVLALGMLTCIRKAFDLMRDHYGVHHDLASIPQGDKDVYDMISAADTYGVFQIESRAQMSMLPRLQPRDFYDLVIEVAIVRPGPIQGDMVHPYLRRRSGLEKVTYPSEALRKVLEKTMGVPLFQEQAMQIAIVAAGFTPGEADQLRRAMATFRRVGTIGRLKERFIEGMRKNGYEQDFAERCFKQIEGFGEYGFPESHAASFALLVYVSCWLKHHYPDVFTCAIINSQPMGFYSTATLARDLYQPYVAALEKKKYEARPADINHSDWHCTLEPQEGADHFALRLGFRLGKGLRETDIDHLVAQRGDGYASIRDLYRRTNLGIPVLKTLADIDAFRSLGLDRRRALWEISALGNQENKRAAIEDLPLFGKARDDDLHREASVTLPEMQIGEHVIRDYKSTSLSLRAHPMQLLRPVFDRQLYLPASALPRQKNGRRVRVAGIVTTRQRPGTASGVVFITMEDETGAIQIIVWPKIFEAHRRIAMSCRLLGVEGKLQIEGGVIHVIAARLIDRSGDMLLLSEEFAPADAPLANADEIRRPADDPRGITEERRNAVKSRTERILPGGRNFR